MGVYKIRIAGFPIGLYATKDEQEALDVYARGVGYIDFDSLLINNPEAKRNDAKTENIEEDQWDT